MVQVAGWIADALRANPALHLIAVLPHHPDQDGRALPPNLIGGNAALGPLHSAAPDRVGIYGIENSNGTPIYVHAKVCILDDIWATTGSDNFNRAAFAASASALQAWHDSARAGPRPKGQLRPLQASPLSLRTRAGAGLAYRFSCDPDGRSPRRRIGNTF